jgi:pimeloyl-ACP methyl ester carboxylesterase
MRSFIRFDPAEYFPRIAIPVLALCGEKDLQVPAAANLEALRRGLSHNPEVTIKAYPGLNHLFQTADAGLPAEYGQIEETFSPTVLADISEWIDILGMK